MCGSATLRIVLSTPCMMFASMIEIVIMPRLGTGANVSPLTAAAPRAASSRPAAHHTPAASSLPDLTRGSYGEGSGEGLSGGAKDIQPPQLWNRDHAGGVLPAFMLGIVLAAR